MLSNTAIEEGRAGRTAAGAPARLAALDVARGVAVVAMVIYHFAWDLSELRLIPASIVGDPGWNAFARAIASGFLLLAGFGLALAHRGGIRWPKLLRRVAILALAALAVTFATWIAFPASYVFFGILHAIAACSVIATPFVRAPPALTALSAVAVGLLPRLALPPTALTILDVPVLAFLGLGSRVPLTNDYVPLVPWLAAVLAGVALGSAGAPAQWLARAGSGPLLPRPLAWLGRHSLVIYLAHQPLLYGVLASVATLTGPHPAAEAVSFRRACAARCGESGQPQAVCRIACRCTLATLREGPLWRAMVQGRVSGPDGERIGEIARSCLARAR